MVPHCHISTSLFPFPVAESDDKLLFLFQSFFFFFLMLLVLDVCAQWQHCANSLRHCHKCGSTHPQPATWHDAEKDWMEWMASTKSRRKNKRIRREIKKKSPRIDMEDKY